MEYEIDEGESNIKPRLHFSLKMKISIFDACKKQKIIISFLSREEEKKIYGKKN